MNIVELREKLQKSEKKLEVVARATAELEAEYKIELEVLEKELAEKLLRSREAVIDRVIQKAVRAGKIFPSQVDFYYNYLFQVDLSEREFSEKIDSLRKTMGLMPQIIPLDEEYGCRVDGFDVPGSGIETETREDLEEELEEINARKGWQITGSSGNQGADIEGLDEDLEGGENIWGKLSVNLI